MTKPCLMCGVEIEGAAQKRYCSPCRKTRYRQHVRSLSPGEAIPQGEPFRYRKSHGYIELRWRVGKYALVTTYEHRVRDGRVVDEDHVHHINGIKDDNSTENLKPIDAHEHRYEHADLAWWQDAADLYRGGLSTYAVGRQVARDPATVWRALVRLGVPLRTEARIAIPNREKKT